MVATLRRMGRPKKLEPSENVRIPQSTLKKIRRVALHLGMTPGDYIANRIAVVLDEDDARRMEAERAEKRPKK